MKISNKKGVQKIISILQKYGIENVVLSPGSRNAPLSLSFAHHPDFKIRVIADERVAAYHALGISLHTKMPTVICCTSGTAVLNYSPAIAESYYQHVPLIVITADRPKEWIDQGDGQTIRQENVFANYILKSCSIEGDVELNSTEETEAIITDLIKISLNEKGPVHLNVRLSEPLYQLTEIPYVKDEVEKVEEKANSSDDGLKDDLRNLFKEEKKIMILAGQMLPDSGLLQVLEKFAGDKNAIVLTENTSNLYSGDFISCIDRTIDGFNEEQKNDFKPDLLITIGGAIVSKKIKAWLRNHPPKNHLKVGHEDLEMDTYRCKTHSVDMLPLLFFYEMMSCADGNATYKNKWMELNAKKLNSHRSFISSAYFSDLKVFSILADKIPAGNLLHLGNSSPIRYAQLFDARKDISYFSNRGVSGIDGCTSTAAGMTDVSNKCVTLISGDISFFYDSNAFWNDYLKNLKVIVINNGGGGIFRIIDQPENVKDTEMLFETRHQRKAEGIAQAFNIKYYSANDENSLKLAMDELYKNNLPGILEIFTPTEKNPLILKNYFDYLKQN